MNPIVKALLSNLGGVAAAGLDAAFQAAAHPTGGFAAALASNSAYLTLYVAGVNFAHILVDQYEAKLGLAPASTSSTQSK